MIYLFVIAAEFSEDVDSTFRPNAIAGHDPVLRPGAFGAHNSGHWALSSPFVSSSVQSANTQPWRILIGAALR